MAMQPLLSNPLPDLNAEPDEVTCGAIHDLVNPSNEILHNTNGCIPMQSHQSPISSQHGPLQQLTENQKMVVSNEEKVVSETGSAYIPRTLAGGQHGAIHRGIQLRQVVTESIVTAVTREQVPIPNLGQHAVIHHGGIQVKQVMTESIVTTVTRLQVPVPNRVTIPASTQAQSPPSVNMSPPQTHENGQVEESPPLVPAKVRRKPTTVANKYGPYPCPRCERVFTVSQTFAAHMNGHYAREETEEETEKRRAAKSKRKKHPQDPTVKRRRGRKPKYVIHEESGGDMGKAPVAPMVPNNPQTP